ncbi:MAG: DUF4291 domain-containing protein [Bacteroidota bacterium]
MNLKTKKYIEQKEEWPQSGYHIMAQYDNEQIIVYQSYRPEIGNFAVENQYFGGAFSLNRMTWIKPNFLWMMYRNGWGTKEGQEVVLAIHLKFEAFEKYVNNTVYSTFNEERYSSREQWQEAVKTSSIRLQWDPDHDPYGEKLDRKAIQIGLRNEMIKTYSNEDIIKIEDVSEFVKDQRKWVQEHDLDKLILPIEKPLLFSDDVLNQKLMLES